MSAAVVLSMHKKSAKNRDIVLDAFRTTDSVLLNNWQNQTQDRQLALSYSFPVSDTTTKEWLDARLHRLEKFPTSVYWAIRDLQGGLFGYTVLASIDYLNENAEIGIYLGFGRKGGIGSRALELTLHNAFNQLHLRKVTARIIDVNSAALALFTKFNFRQEGELVDHIKIDNDWHNLILLSRMR